VQKVFEQSENTRGWYATRLTVTSPDITADTSDTASQLSETEFLNVLTEQARVIAKNILETNPDAGTDLATDAKVW